MHKRSDRRALLRCTLCGREIPWGAHYWHCNGCVVCGGCLRDFAAGELAPYRQVRGEEALP